MDWAQGRSVRWDGQARCGNVGKWLHFIICARFGQFDWTDLRNKSGSAEWARRDDEVGK